MSGRLQKFLANRSDSRWEARRRPELKEYGQVTASGPLQDVLQMLDGSPASYGAVYRKITPVRTVVDFLADAIATTPLKVYRRTENGRPEVYDHPFAVLLRNPNPDLTSYQLKWRLAADLLIYADAYWRKVQAGQKRSLVPLPPFRVTPRGGDLLSASAYDFVSPNGLPPQRFSQDEVVHMHTYNPEEPRIGSSKLAALRTILLEEVEASKYRLGYYKNHARLEFALTHPGQLSLEAQERIRVQFENTYSGSSNSGRTAIFEEGMQPVPMSMSPRDAEFMAGRAFVLEATARAYNLPVALLSLTQTATYASQREFHKQLYCVAPETPILKADLTYVPAGKLADGDEVFGFDEKPLKGNQRRLVTATVTNTTRGVRDLVRVTTTHSTVVVSAEHPFLVTTKFKTPELARGCFAWVRADQLDAARHSIVSLGPVWEREETHAAGWLAGMTDGEGYAVRRGGIGITQKEGPALDRIEAELLERGFDFTRHSTGRDKGVASVVVNGGFPESARFMGTIRPERLIAKRRWTERTQLRQMLKAEILAVEPLGTGEVVELSTSSRTFVAAGLFSHNTEVLPPWFELIQSEIELQLMPWFSGTEEFYVEFVVEQKLRGDFLDRATILNTAIGRPWMTVVEGRNIENLDDRGVPEDEELVVPVGPNFALEGMAENMAVPNLAPVADLPVAASTLERFFDRQERSVTARIRAKHANPFDRGRWDHELAEVLGNKAMAQNVNMRIEFMLASGMDPHEIFNDLRSRDLISA